MCNFYYILLSYFIIIMCINIWFWVIFTFSKQFLGDIFQLCMIVFVSISYNSHMSWSSLVIFFFLQGMDSPFYYLDWQNIVARLFIYVMCVTLFYSIIVLFHEPFEYNHFHFLRALFPFLPEFFFMSPSIIDFCPNRKVFHKVRVCFSIQHIHKG